MTFALFHLANELLCIIACRRVVRQPHAGRVVIFSTWPANMEVIAGHLPSARDEDALRLCASSSAACPYPASIIIQETRRGGWRAMFPKVPCDHSRFAATRGYCVTARPAARARVRRRRARARRLHGHGGERAALRPFGLIERPTLIVATTRKPVNGARAAPWYGAERASSINVARAKLTPPDDGRFSLASVGLVDWRIDAVEPVPKLPDLVAEGGGDVLIYVHGFNTTFETAALDAARLSDGIRFAGQTMVFSWPSKAKLLDYGYDRESAMWSRDALEEVLDELIASPGGRTRPHRRAQHRHHADA